MIRKLSSGQYRLYSRKTNPTTGKRRNLPEAARSLAPGGALSIVGGLTGYDGEIPASALLGNVAKAQSVFVGSRADFRQMIAFIRTHRLHPVIDRVLPFEEYEQAMSLLESDRFVGKIVLRLDESQAPQHE